MAKRFGALSSSTDPNKIANTVSGIVLSLSALIIYIAGQFGVPIAEGDIGELATGLGATAGGLWTLYGLIMKVVVAYTSR